MQTHPKGAIADPTEAAMRAYYAEPVDLTDCEREPLHLIQVIQPHACLLVADAETLVVEVASENTAEHIGRDWRTLLGQPLDTFLEAGLVGRIRRCAAPGAEQRHPFRINFAVGGEVLGRQIICRRDGARLLLEIEPAQEGLETAAFQERLGEAIAEVQGLTNYATMFQEVTEVVARISGYHRVSLYRFDPEYNGEVIAEVIQPHHESWLNLRYPASDIPRQARELYFRNRVRMLSDAVAPQVFLRKHDATPAGQPAPEWSLDLTAVDCRGLSPVHAEYLANIGTAATMSIAIILDGRLWGLFSLHHDTPRYLDFELRGFLKFIGQIFSGHLALQAATEYRRRVLEVNVNRSRLGDQISESQEIGPALTEGAVTLLAIIKGVHGAAVAVEGEVHRLGRAPSAEQLDVIAEYVKREGDDPTVFTSDHLCGELPEAEAFKDTCAGMLLVWLDRERGEYIAWFREEIVRHVNWGGRPEKLEVATEGGGVRLAPRKSFAKYAELVNDRSEPWTDAEIDAALALRSHIKDVVLRRYQQVKRANADLALAYKEMESFSYTVSHDLRAPLRSINGFAEILMEDYAKALDADALMMLARIQDSTDHMNAFIDDLLQLAKVGVSGIDERELDFKLLAHEAYDALSGSITDRLIDFTVDDDLPTALGDRRMMAVTLNNLIGNAVKYSGKRDRAEIHFGYDPALAAYYLRDNGEGFDQRYADRVFEMFTRLTEDSTIDGTGVGLALVQRVIDKHGGKIWVESELGTGTTFYFTVGGV